MRLGRRLSTGSAQDPPAVPAEPTELADPGPDAAEAITSPDQRAAEIVADAARRELAPER